MPYVVLAVVLIGGSIFYSRYQAAQMAKQAKKDRAKHMGTIITTRDPAAQRRIIYGRRRTGGYYAFIHSTDVEGGVKNEYLHLVVVLAGHQVEAIDDIYLDDKELTLDGAGNCTAPSQYAGRVRVKKHLGGPNQSADAALIAAAPDKWTAEHRLRGIAYVYVRLKYEPTNLATIPNISALVRGKKLYDPRTGLTAYSTNPALAIRDYLTDTDYGLGAEGDELDEASFIAAANLCEEPVARASGGNEPRYACSGVIDRDRTPAEVLTDLATSMSAAVINTGGLWHISGGAYSAPTYSFGPDDLRGQISIQTKDSRRETCNAVKGTYVAANNKWQDADYPPVKNALYTAEDGERIWRELDLPFTSSSSTAQRLAKIELEQARQQIAVRLPVKLTGLRVRAGDTVYLNFPRYGWANKPFEVVGWKLALEDGTGSGRILGVDLTVRETAPGVWDWNNGEETTVDLAPNTTLPDPTAVPAPTALNVTSFVQHNADGSVSGRLRVTWVAPLDAFARAGRVQIQYKLAADSTWTSYGSVAGDDTDAVIPGLVSGSSYLVRIRSRRPGGAVSAWVVTGAAIVAAGDTTAPGVPTTASVSAIYKGARVRWTNPGDADLAFVEVFEASAVSPAPNAGSLAYARVYGTDYVRQGLDAGAQRWYWLRSVDASGNRSAWVAAGSATASAIDTAGIFPITSTQISDNAVTTPKLAANSVTADQVGTNQIIATSANLANAVVTTAKIATLSVNTLRIQDNAVTIPVSSYTGGSITLDDNNTWVNVQSAAISATGAPIMVIAAALCDTQSTSTSTPYVEWRIVRNSTTLVTISPPPAIRSLAYDGGIDYFITPPPFSYSLGDFVSSGNHTYYLQARVVNQNSTNFSITRRSLLLLETKK